MGRLDDMAARLPQLYRDGELIRGAPAADGGVLGVPAVQLEIVEEDAREIQLAHFFDAARNLDEAAALAAVLDIAPEPWQTLPLFRAWVHALRDAMLEHGAVTVRGIQRFVDDYAAGFQSATRIRAARSGSWSKTRSNSLPALIENPRRVRWARVPGSAGTEPLTKFEVDNAGLDESVANFLLTGTSDGPEYVPVLVNVTTQQALVFLGKVPVGARLWLDVQGDQLRARLEADDVSTQLYSVSNVVPGTAWQTSAAERPARPLRLARGTNQLWFLPLAHYDALGLDRFLSALPDLLLQQGRFDSSQFDRALFHQPGALTAFVGWLETQPARFDVELPAGTFVGPAARSGEALELRATLERALDDGVARLRAAGVASSVRLRDFSEAQPQRDRLRLVLPLTHRELGPSGADRLPDMGGVFEVTTYEESTYR